jgi:hypothetical protein
MFNHPEARQEAVERREDLLGAEQFCTECHRWTAVPLAEIRATLESDAAPPVPGQFGVPFRRFPCMHCSAHQLVITPGKYDPLRAERYTMQRYSFRSDPTIGALPPPDPRPPAPRRGRTRSRLGPDAGARPCAPRAGVQPPLVPPASALTKDDEAVFANVKLVVHPPFYAEARRIAESSGIAAALDYLTRVLYSPVPVTAETLALMAADVLEEKGPVTDD